MKTQNVKVIDYGEFNALVEETYKRPYNIQQQGDCISNGSYVEFSVPEKFADDFEETEILSEDDRYGVSFKAWLERDPKLPFFDDDIEDWLIKITWERNFYPELGTLVNDLHSKGLLEEGKYLIKVSW